MVCLADYSHKISVLIRMSFVVVVTDALRVNPASILYKSVAGRYRPVSYPDGPITARYRFIKNAYWENSSIIG